MNDTPAPPRKRRRFLKFALVFVGVLLLIVGFAPWIIANTSLKDFIIEEKMTGLKGKATARIVSRSWFGPVEWEDVVVADASGRPALTVPRMFTQRNLWDLLLNLGEPGKITLYNPTLTVISENGSTNIEQVIANFLVDDGSPSRPERIWVNIVVEEGTIKLINAKTGETTLHNLNLDLNIPKSRSEPVRLVLSAESRTATTGTMNVDAKFTPANTLGVNATAFDLSQLAPILPRFASGTTAKGTFTSALTLQWGEKGTSLNGKADAAMLELAGPWLGSDRLALDSVSIDSEVTQDGGVVKAKKLNVVCDVGHVSFSGELDPSADTQGMLAHTGIALDVKLDFAKLSAKIPALLRIREGVEIHEGTVTAQLRSHPGEHGPAWVGTISTTQLTGVVKIPSLLGDNITRRPIEWKQPLTAKFDLRIGKDRMPTFDQFEVKADFIGLAARGELHNFVAAANIDLKKLSDHLNDFADIGYTLGGTAFVKLQNIHNEANNASALEGSFQLKNLTMLDAGGIGVRENQLDGSVRASITRGAAKEFGIGSASATVTSGEDTLELILPTPIPDVRKLSGGDATLKLQGDFARWIARIGPMIGWPADWELGGTGTLNAHVQMKESKFTCDSFALNMKDARFYEDNSKIEKRPRSGSPKIEKRPRSGALDLDLKIGIVDGPSLFITVNEPTLNVTAKAEYDRKSKTVVLNDVNVSCNTLGASAKKLEMRPAADGQYGLAGDVNLQAQVGRLMRTLNMATEMEGLAKGKATFDAGTPGQVLFDADLKVENFRYGPAAKPTWSEPWITLQTQGKFSGDDIAITSAKITRDGFSAQGQGKIDDLAGATNVDVKGTLTYDLAKLEPQLKAYLGKTGQASGSGTKPFQLNGNLSNGGQNLAVNVGDDLPGSTKRDPLAGNAALEWQSLKAYGFDVGRAELKADLRDNAVKMSPVEATFGGGKIRVEPTLQLNKDYDLSFAQGTIIQQAKLTPAACSEAIGYALPLLANVADASGTISFELAKNRIPLTDPGMGTLAGTLIIHEAEVSPNEVISQIAGLFTQKTLKIKLAREERVPIRMENGRVYHENLTITLDGVTIRSSGSVGVFDSSLHLVIQVPLQGKLAEAMVPADRPRIREAVGKQTVEITVKGTMGKPLADREAFRTAVGKVIQDATKDAAAGAADDLIKKGLEGLFQKK